MPSASELARREEEAAGVGHNSVAVDELRLLIERVERLESEEADLRADKKDVYSEAKARGYDVRTMKKVVAYRKLETQVRQERRALEDTYLSALGLD